LKLARGARQHHGIEIDHFALACSSNNKLYCYSLVHAAFVGQTLIAQVVMPNVLSIASSFAMLGFVVYHKVVVIELLP
jgi:hypothetical protein